MRALGSRESRTRIQDNDLGGRGRVVGIPPVYARYHTWVVMPPYFREFSIKNQLSIWYHTVLFTLYEVTFCVPKSSYMRHLTNKLTSVILAHTR